MGIPAALFTGFLLGFVLRGPIRNAPERSSLDEEEPEAKVVVFPQTKTSTAKTNSPRPEQIFTGWDEKTIRSLGLPEIKNRLNQLSTWPPGPQTDRMERWLVKRWAALEPREACQFAYAAVLQGAETSLLEEALQIWANISPASAAAWAGSLGSPSLRDLAVRLAFRIWAGKDSSAAARAASQLRSGSARTVATVAVAPPQARKNFSAAMDWARSLPGNKRQKTLEEILGEWTRRDPAAAATWLVQQPGDVQWSLVGKLAADWVRKDPATALAWGQGHTQGLETGSELASGPVQRKFFEAALANLIGADPETAATWLASPAGQPYLETRAAPLAGRWTALDPADAAAWAMGLTNTLARQTALGAVAGTWGRIEPAEAGIWISTLEPGSIRDGALLAYCNAISAYDAAVAASWANSISQPGPREATLTAVFKQWRRYDEAAARNFILQNSNLSPAARQRILQ
ncbi:MAG: hypothetical protein RLZZ112_923 [Verrucomicrobiota bacterium]